jgi:FAD/FMN-containing dehydrogenase
LQLKRRGALKLSDAFSATALSTPTIVQAQSRSPLSAKAGSTPKAYNLRTAKTPEHHLLCRSTEDVVEALVFVRQEDLPFSILSSGHCFEGFSHNDHAVIDLSNMNHAAIADDHHLTTEPGTNIRQAQIASAAQGRALSAGLCNTVAMGGHLGCGGIGYLSRAHGLLCDQLVSAEVVTADGKLTTASVDENPDLFWAIRGGGPGSFGIVTQATFRTQPNPKTIFIRAFFNLPMAEAVSFFQAWQSWAMGLPREISVILNLGTNDRKNLFFKVEVVSVAYANVTRAFIRALVALAKPAIDPQIFQGTYTQVGDEIWPKDYYPSAPAKFGSDFVTEFLPANVLEAVFAMILDTPRPRLNLFVERLGGAIGDVDETATGYVHRKANFLVQYAAQFNNVASYEDQLAHFRKFRDGCSKVSEGAAYCGYPDRDNTSWGLSYWGQNFERLKKVKRQYDPENVFRHPQSIPLV